MIYDRSGGVGPNGQAPGGVRIAFRVVGILAALGLVVIALVVVGLEVRQHHDRQATQRNESAATSQVSARAQAFYHDLTDSAKTAAPTQSQIQALLMRDKVVARPPFLENGSVRVTFSARMVYVEPGFYGGTQDTVELCYRATVPIAPATTPAATLQEITCPVGGI